MKGKTLFGRIWTDEENGIYFEVVKANLVSDQIVEITVKHSKEENAELKVYKRRAYAYDKLTYFALINGLELKLRAFKSGYTNLSCHSITKVYLTKGNKKVSTTINGKKPVAEKVEVVEKAEVVETATEQKHEDGIVRHEKYNAIKACLELNIPVYLAGPAGSGKNYTVEQICDELGWDFYFSNSVQQEYKLTGFIDAGGKFHDTEFYKACTSEKDCVFFLDEMDASIPEVLVLLNAAIANGYFEFPAGKVELNHVHFVAAGNTVGSGSDELYTGRAVIDQATLDRFAIIEFGYDRNVEISLAKGDVDLVNFISAIRKAAESIGTRATFSYRAIIMVTKLNSSSMGMKEILTIAVFKGLDKDTVKQLINAANFNGSDNRYCKAANSLKAA